MARAALNWTVRELATKAGVNKNTVSRFEAGKDILSSSLAQIEKVLIDEGIHLVDADGELGPGVRVTKEFMLDRTGKAEQTSKTRSRRGRQV
jgi:transcriptional regulator with XRE-family HTH domain